MVIQRFGSYERFSHWGVGDLRIGKSISYEIQANWKLILENFMECYHYILINLVDDHVVIHTIWPEEPDRSRVVCDWLFDPDVMAMLDFDPMDAVEFFDIVNKQDWEVCELTQQGMASRAFKSGGVYVPSEWHIRELTDFILEKLD